MHHGDKLHKGVEIIQALKDVFGEITEIQKTVYLFRYFVNYFDHLAAGGHANNKWYEITEGVCEYEK